MAISDKELKDFIIASRARIAIQQQKKLMEDIKNGRFNK